MSVQPDQHDIDTEIEEEARYIGGIIKRVGTFSNETLEDRKQFQKTVYLIQAFGIDLGYDYNWYVHGPYSPELAKVGYALADIYDGVEQTQFSKQEYEEQFQRFLDYVEPIKQEVSKLEAAASLHWLRQQNPELPHDLLIDYLLDEKENLDENSESCEMEWRRLEKYGLV